MKVLLLSANKLTEPYPVYPLGLDYVAGSISEKHQVEILDMNDFKNLDSLGEAIKKIAADVIGISLRNIDNTDTRDTKYFIGQYQKIAEQARKNSSALIVLGGSGFTIFPLELMNALRADYGIIGEGERFGLMLDTLEKNGNPLELPGVINIDSIAKIPAPWDSNTEKKFESHNSNVQFYLERGGMLNLQTKRGCSFRCVYCTYPYIEGGNLRLGPPDDIAKSARKLQDAGAKYLFITDSAINCSYAHSLEVAKAFVKAGLSIPWGAFFAPTKPPDDYYRILADAGLSHAEFGTESLSKKMLDNYRKPFKVEDVFTSHKLACDAGIYVAHYLLFGGPGENNGTLDETLKNSSKLARAVFFIFCGIRIYPHTELYDIAKEEKQVSESQNLLEPVFYQSPSISSENIIKRVEDHSKGRSNWIIGSGGRRTARLLKRMYAQGHSGPLWERLIQ